MSENITMPRVVADFCNAMRRQVFSRSTLYTAATTAIVSTAVVEAGLTTPRTAFLTSAAFLLGYSAGRLNARRPVLQVYARRFLHALRGQLAPHW